MRLLQKETLLILILIGSFLIRFINFDYPLINGETQRDYLTARHIVRFSEFPLTGPCCIFNGSFGEIRNSPIYYYFLASILFFKDDILFLNFVNILFQVGTVFLVFLIAQRLFGTRTALISSILFSISLEVLRQSLFVWQPHIMHPFVLLSYLFLTLSFLKRKYSLLLISVFLFLFSASLHNTVYAILPSFVFLVFLILRNLKSERKRFLQVSMLFLSLLFIFYLPWFIHLSKTTLHTENFFISFSDFPAKFLQASNTLLSTLLPVYKEISFVMFLILLIVYFKFKKGKGREATFAIILIGTIIQFLILVSLFKIQIWSYYFTPILGLSIILFSHLINSVLSKTFVLKLAKIALVIFLIKVFSFNFAYIKGVNTLQNLQDIRAVTSMIEKEMKTASIDPQSFAIKFYPEIAESPVNSDLILWAALEKDLGEKFIKVTDSNLGWELKNDDENLFVVCEKECSPIFLKNNGFSVLRAVPPLSSKRAHTSAPFSIYLAKKSQEPEIVQIKATSSLDRQVILYKQLIERVGSEKAQTALFKSGLPYDGQAHLLNHTVGDMIYQKYGVEGLSLCKDYFLSSCYHGFLIHAIADGGLEKLGEVMKKCWEKGEHVAFQCSHAIGHGLLAWVGYTNLTDALKNCSELVDKSSNFPFFNCLDGVFMENIWAVHESGEPSKDRWIKDDDPIYPCNDPRIQKHEYINACWSNQPMRLYQLFSGDIKRVSGFCNALGDQTHQGTCFDGLARQIHPVASGNIDQVIQMCSLMPISWVDPCIISVARAELSVGGKVLSFKLCELLNSEFKKQCFESLSKIRY